MIEHKKTHVPYELLDEELDRFGREGWVPWDKEVSEIPGGHKSGVTVRLWRGGSTGVSELRQKVEELQLPLLGTLDTLIRKVPDPLQDQIRDQVVCLYNWGQKAYEQLAREHGEVKP